MAPALITRLATDMPLSERRKKELAQVSPLIYKGVRYGTRHFCTFCGAIHQFYDDHCHNPKCGKKVELRKVDTGATKRTN